MKLNVSVMKRLVLLTLFGALFALPMKSQDVFNQVVNIAKKVIDDPRADPFMLGVSQFKYTALNYICNTAIKQNGGGVKGDWLDKQAYGLNHFIISYFTDLARAKNSDKAMKDVTLHYWKACAENVLFPGQDKEITEVFIQDRDCITPFSLNTDWEKADKAISKE